MVANPTLILTLLYALVTGLGILSSWSLYTEFGINIFDYAEIGDFLLAAFKSPGALENLVTTLSLFILMPVAYILTSILSRWLTALTARFSPRSSEGSNGLERPSVSFWYTVFVPIIAVVFIAWMVTTYKFAKYEAQSIKRGEKQLVVVQYRSFSGSAGQVTKPGLELIGSTQKVVFFYDLNDKNDYKDDQLLVIPQTQIVSIEVPNRGPKIMSIEALH